MTEDSATEDVTQIAVSHPTTLSQLHTNQKLIFLPQEVSHEPRQTFQLLSLPPEVRTLIYDHSLVLPNEIIPYPGRAEELEPLATSSDLPNLALLLVSHQVRHEALPCLYSKNI